MRLYSPFIAQRRLRSATEISVALFTGPSLGSGPNKVLRMRSRKSFIICSVMLKFAPISRGRNDGELSALLATGIIVFGVKEAVYGFRMPSLTPVIGGATW